MTKTMKLGLSGARSVDGRNDVPRFARILSPRLLVVSIAIVLLLAGAAVGWSQTGGGFDLSWSSVDGGGAISTGGGYEVLGVIGQPDAATLTGGSFELTSGFLNYDTAQVPVELSGFVLE